MWWLVGGQAVLVKQHSITSQKTCILLSWPVLYMKSIYIHCDKCLHNRCSDESAVLKVDIAVEWFCSHQLINIGTDLLSLQEVLNWRMFACTLIFWILTVWQKCPVQCHLISRIALLCMKAPNLCLFLLLIRVVLGLRWACSTDGMTLKGKTEVLEEKPVLWPLFQPQMSHGLAQGGPQASD